MKKFFAMLIACVLAVSVTGLAEVDLSGMNNEDLIKLQQDVSNAIYENGGAVVLQPGDYVAGKDIAAGSYVIRFYENADDYTYGKIIVYASVDAMKTYDSDYKDYLVKISIIDGNISNGFEYSLADKPDKFEEGNYIITNLYERFAIGSSCRIILEEGQVLHVEIKANEMTTTIERAQGLFMD